MLDDCRFDWLQKSHNLELLISKSRNNTIETTIPQFLSFVLLIYLLPLAVLLTALCKSRVHSRPLKRDFSVSILVSVRDEEEAIVTCLTALEAQEFDGQRIEMIVADDNSSDGTFERINAFADKSSADIKIIQNPNPDKYKSSKKAALETAAQQATGDILLFTDADCRPGKNWARSMASMFDDSIGLVAGFSPQTAPGGLWGDVLQIDAAAAAFVAAGTIESGRGVTCTGRNLAVRKQALLDVGGYASLPDSLSGDDDFLLHKISRHRQWKVRYAFSPGAVVPAAGPKNVRCFLQQKRRHLSAGKAYRPFAQFVYALFHLANLAVWLGPLAAFYFRAPLLFVPLGAKLVADYCCLHFFLRKFQQQIRPKAFLLWQPLFLFYNIFTGPTSFGGKLEWGADACVQKADVS